jgi:hypothetical protein
MYQYNRKKKIQHYIWQNCDVGIKGTRTTRQTTINRRSPSVTTHATPKDDQRCTFFCNPILFTICTSTFNKLCKETCIQWHVEEC